MLGKTAGGLFWMFRALERSENMARLINAGFRLAMTHASGSDDEWASVITTAGQREACLARHGQLNGPCVIDFLLRDKSNPSSVISLIEQARSNARLVRIALTREVWEATNESWMVLTDALSKPLTERELPAVLNLIGRQSALVRGALHGTMLRDDMYDFARIGTFLERADSTARILDVKYYVLLPSVSLVGTSLDNTHWETILDAVSGQAAFKQIHAGEISARAIAEFLIMDRRMPRSLAFCAAKIGDNLDYLADGYGTRKPSNDLADAIRTKLRQKTTDTIFETGLHEFLEQFIRDNNALGSLIEQDFRFYK